MSSGRVLLTRAGSENAPLAPALEAVGFEVAICPLMQIQALESRPEAQTAISPLDHYQAVVVTSKHAARLFRERVEDRWPQWPVGIHWLALGTGTADILADAGLTVTVPDRGHRSEDLLALPLWQSQPFTLLVKGEGGRDLIAPTLRAAGCRVDTLAVYRRVFPEYDRARLAALLCDWRPEVIVLLSAETLRHFLHLSENVMYSRRDVRFLVPSDRVAAEAGGHAREVLVLEKMTTESQLNTIRCALKDRNPTQDR